VAGLGALALVGAAVPLVLPVVLALDVLLVVLVALDLARTPAPGGLGLQRELPGSVGLSQPLRRTLVFGGDRLDGLLVELREEFPAGFHVVARTDDTLAGPDVPEEVRAARAPRPGEVPPVEGDPTGGPDRVVCGEGGATAVRVYRAERRGRHSLGDLRVRVRGPLGLVWRQERFAGDQPVAVEPALVDLSRTLALAASERWQDLGVRKLRRRGGQTEFESLRDYVHGDDVRLVDWKATAKRGKPTVRQYQEERGQELILLVDAGRRMRAVGAEGELAGWSKLDWALDAALQLAAVALQRGDRVGCAVFDAGLRSWVSPAKGARQLARLREAVFDELPTDRESDLSRALREIAARHRRRAMVVVLSDVADPLSVGAQRRALAAGSRRHRLVFACLDDPELRALAEGARTDLGEASHHGALRAAALELAEDRRRALRELSTTGVRVLDALPAEAAGPLLAAWLDERHGGAA
jgi:uncharacterized protein (DUF58 family)